MHNIPPSNTQIGGKDQITFNLGQLNQIVTGEEGYVSKILNIVVLITGNHE